jgi:hypothetical protein
MRKLKGSQGCIGKLSFPFPFKLTWNRCRMFWSADAEVPGGGLSASTTIDFNNLQDVKPELFEQQVGEEGKCPLPC